MQKNRRKGDGEKLGWEKQNKKSVLWQMKQVFELAYGEWW